MYFSVISPARESIHQAAYSLLDGSAQGPYRDHQWLWKFFPAPEQTSRDFLFRRGEVEGLPRFYTVSARPPVCGLGGWEIQTRPYAPQLTAGQQLRFELRANPVFSRRVAKGTDAQATKVVRHDVVMHAKRQLLAKNGLQRWCELGEEGKPLLYELVYSSCKEWLEKRAEAGGFSIVDDELQIEGYMQYAENHRPKRRKKEEGAGGLTFSTVDYSGILTVTDADLFQKTLFQGLGKAKAFGCGLMLVKRAY